MVFPSSFVVLERGWLSSNSLVVLGEDTAAVIDTGYIAHAAQTEALVAEAIGARSLTHIVNTHLHSDHCGGNATLKRRWPEARTLIPPGLAGAVQVWDEVALTYTPTGQRCECFGFDALLQPGEVIELAGERFEVHAAPGHDPHSAVLFHAASRTLLSADALWEHGFGVVFPALEGADAFAEVGDTLDVIERLNPLAVIPGHGKPFSDVPEALARARSKLAYFVANPDKHALHGIKVLIKYHLLDLQSEPRAQFDAWLHGTSYFSTVFEAHGDGTQADWLDAALQSLVRSKAIAIDANTVSDLP